MAVEAILVLFFSTIVIVKAREYYVSLRRDSIRSAAIRELCLKNGIPFNVKTYAVNVAARAFFLYHQGFARAVSNVITFETTSEYSVHVFDFSYHASRGKRMNWQNTVVLIETKKEFQTLLVCIRHPFTTLAFLTYPIMARLSEAVVGRQVFVERSQLSTANRIGIAAIAECSAFHPKCCIEVRGKCILIWSDTVLISVNEILAFAHTAKALVKLVELHLLSKP